MNERMHGRRGFDERRPQYNIASRFLQLLCVVWLGGSFGVSGLAAQPLELTAPDSEPTSEGLIIDAEESGAEQAAETIEGEVLTDETAPSVFLRAGEAYGEGNYALAVDEYSALVSSGFGTADVHYNLANSLLRSGELGRAIAGYRRALHLSPRDEDVIANLRFARQSTKDAVAPPAPSPWSQTLLFWHHSLSVGETVKLLIVVAAFLWLLVGIQLMSTVRLRGLTLLLALVVIVLAASLLVRWRSPQRIAVILPAQTDVYSGTDLQSRVIFNLHAGTELAVTSSDERWTQFRMPDGQRGWLPTEHVEIVAP